MTKIGLSSLHTDNAGLKRFQDKFAVTEFDFRCRAVQAGRIFSTRSELSLQQIDMVEGGILYYANESESSQNSHPVADLWFMSGDGKLVIVDVGGTSNETAAQRKVDAMSAVLAEQGGILVGVVLLPIFDGQL